MAIGICDWGIGGVGLYQHLRKRSSIDVVYFSDTGYTPYGKVPEAELKQRLSQVFAYFNRLGITQIIVGCNAASTVLTNETGVIGIIEHGVQVVLNEHISQVGIVGGKRTVESEIYKKQLEKKGVEVHQRIAQPLSARIEAGDIHSTALDKEIEEIFAPIRHLDHILLACTHYPLIKDQIAKFTGNTIFLDPAEEMVNWILDAETELC